MIQRHKNNDEKCRPHSKNWLKPFFRLGNLPNAPTTGRARKHSQPVEKNQQSPSSDADPDKLIKLIEVTVSPKLQSNKISRLESCTIESEFIISERQEVNEPTNLKFSDSLYILLFQQTLKPRDMKEHKLSFLSVQSLRNHYDKLQFLIDSFNKNPAVTRLCENLADRK